MQKIFTRFFLVLMIITVSITLAGNFALQTVYAQRRAEEDAMKMIGEIADRIASNQVVIDGLMTSLNENYITRADALAEIIAQNPDVMDSTEEMDRLAKRLRVDEVHVTDEKGILRWGNVPDYYGLDFYDTTQTTPFLPALTDKEFALAQAPQPNGSEGKLFQYISVARQDKTGIVQVGVRPEVLDEALANNRIDVVINNFNVNEGVSLMAFDKISGIVKGDSHRAYLGQGYWNLNIPEELFRLRKTSDWIEQEGKRLFAVYGEVGDYRIGVNFTQENLFESRKVQNITATVSSVLLGTTIIVAIFILLKRRIISDIELVNQDLTRITAGNLDVVVHAGATPEFVVLSGGINQMVGSIRRQMEEIMQQTAQLEESNKSILASLKYARKIQNNLLPSSKAFDETFADYSILWEPRDIVGGDIYWMKRFDENAVLCVCDCTGHGTPGALLTMLVVSMLDAIVNEDTAADTAGILWELDQRLASTLNVAEGEKDAADINDGADLVILYIRKDGEITLSSAKLHVFLCDGETVENIKGQKISIGEGGLKSREEINTLTIPGGRNNSYYIVSDGLFEQMGDEEHIPFGYSRFKRIVMENHGKAEAEVTRRIWQEFSTHMGGENRRDDVTLVGFRLPAGEEKDF